MPALPTTTPLYFKSGATFVDFSGKTRTSSIRVVLSTTDPTPIIDNLILNATNLFTRMGEMSNAAVIRVSWGFEREVTAGCDDVTVFDETYSSVGTVSQFTYRDGYGGLHYIDLPAPDASLFLADRVTLDLNDTVVAAALTSLENIFELAAPGSPPFNPCLVSTALTNKGGRGQRSKTKFLPEIVEPSGTDEPGGSPALPAPTP